MKSSTRRRKLPESRPSAKRINSAAAGPAPSEGGPRGTGGGGGAEPPRVPRSAGQSQDCRGVNGMLWQNSRRFISYVNKKIIRKKSEAAPQHG